jgi:hypothetical protein
MADGAHWPAATALKKAVWLPFNLIAGCPGGQSRKNVLVVGEGCVLIHHVNAN